MRRDIIATGVFILGLSLFMASLFMAHTQNKENKKIFDDLYHITDSSSTHYERRQDTIRRKQDSILIELRRLKDCKSVK